MSFKQVKCPSCGAPGELEYRFSKMFICEFCNQSSHLVNDNLEAAGEKSSLADYGSMFYKGATGIIDNREFKVLGRLRFSYPDGFWDEWLLNFKDSPDKEYWLQEDEGDYTLFEKGDISSLPDFEELSVGNKYQLGNKEIFITEKHEATILGGDGELPYMVIPGQQADFVDGIIIGAGMQSSIEYFPDEKVFNIGKPIDLKSIQVNEKEESPYKF